MAHLFVALLLALAGLDCLFGLSVPLWVTCLLVPMSGVTLAMERFGLRVDRK